MATEIKLPMLGETVDSGEVTRVLVSAGDFVTEDQPVIEIDTEKATVEVPASAGGIVKDVRVKQGETIKVGQVILTLEEGAEAKTGEQKAGPSIEPKASSPKTESELKPEEPVAQKAEPVRAGPQADSKTVVKRLERVGPDKPRPAVLEDKLAAGPESAPASGREAQPPVGKAPGTQAQDQAPASAPPVKENPYQRPKQNAEQQPRQHPVNKPGPRPEQKAQSGAKPGFESGPQLAPAGPSARRLARELAVDINEVKGSGSGSRISDEDVRSYARSIILNTSAGQPAALKTATAPPLPDFSKWGVVERQPMSGVRRKTMEHTLNAWRGIPHVTQFDQADITDLESLRERFAKRALAAGGKLTITAIALKVAASALKLFPQFNASVDPEQEQIIYKKYYHIGIAVDTDRGLLVPVIRDVDKKNLLALAIEIGQAAQRARDKKITLEEMQGGTFTITNLGSIGGVGFTPIINAPEVAILGIARASLQPVYRDGSFEPRLMLPLSLSYDHRLIDGADAARFLRWVAEAIEQPLLLALEG